MELMSIIFNHLGTYFTAFIGSISTIIVGAMIIRYFIGVLRH